MIFLTESLLKDNRKFLNLIDKEIALTQATLDSQKTLKLILLDYMQKLATSTNINKTNSSELLKVLLSFKNSLELSNVNLINLENLLNLHNDLKAMDKETILNQLSVTNLTIIDLNEEVLKNNCEIFQTLRLSCSPSIQTNISKNNSKETVEEPMIINNIENEFNIDENNNFVVNQNINPTTVYNNEVSDSVTTQESTISNNEISNIVTETIQEINETTNVETENFEENSQVQISNNEITSYVAENVQGINEDSYRMREIASTINNIEAEHTDSNLNNIPPKNEENEEEHLSIQENTLIISEKTKKVFLPYDYSSVEEVFINNPSKYSSIEDIIKTDFVLPLEQFKFPSISRFREAFKLMRYKENSSFKEALDLSFELLFNYNLHPAIISACRNLDELDIYLDYLADNETHKFSCFKIIFEVAPTLSKHNFRKNNIQF